MNNITKQLTNEIKAQYSISQCLFEHGISTKAVGARTYCLCPFHSEKTPSCLVNDEKGQLYCFACHTFTDVIGLVMHLDHLNFREAMDDLCKKLNIYINEDEKKEFLHREKLLATLDKLKKQAIKEFNALPSTHLAKQEIAQRNLSYDNTLNFYGYIGGDLDGSIDREYLKELKLYNDRGGFLLKRRLLFFVNDRFSAIRGFTARKLEDDFLNGKYVNSPASSVFDKSSLIYNFDLAKKTIADEKNVYITEGTFDTIALYEHGYKNVVCTLGTALTAQALERLINTVDDGRITLLFDNDEAGYNATKKVVFNYPQWQDKFYMVQLPCGYKDPCEFFKDNTQLPQAKIALLSIFEIELENIKKKLKENNVDESLYKKSIYDYINKEVLSKISNDILKDYYNKKLLSALNMEIIQQAKTYKLAEKMNYNIRVDNYKIQLEYLKYFVRNKDYFKESDFNYSVFNSESQIILKDLIHAMFNNVLPKNMDTLRNTVVGKDILIALLQGQSLKKEPQERLVHTHLKYLEKLLSSDKKTE